MVIFVLMSFSATYLHQSTSLLQNFPMLGHVQTLHNNESSNMPSYESGTSMYTPNTPSQNASSIFFPDSGPSYLPSNKLSSSPLSNLALQSLSDIDNEILGIDFLCNILFCQFSTGVCISIFSDDIDILRHSLSLHGVPSFNLTLNDCRYALIYHIFEGFCYDFKLDISSASNHLDVAVSLKDSHPGKS